MGNLKVKIKMIKQYKDTQRIYPCLMQICSGRFRAIILLSGMMVAGCAAIPDSRTPKLDQEFGKSVQSSKDTQRIQVDPNKVQSAGGPTSREERVYVDNYIRGSLTTGTALDAPITTGAGR